jgi:ABC-type glycerol-3-phosphate transport system substrate-binding protein
LNQFNFYKDQSIVQPKKEKKEMSNQKITRRNFLKAASLAGGTLALAACTPQKTALSPVETSSIEEPVAVATAAAPVTVQFWYYWSGIWGEAMDTIAKSFNDQSSSVKVETTTTAGEWQKVLAAFAAGTPPDVLLDFTASQLVPRDQVNALDDLIANSSFIKPDNYYPVMLDVFKWEGKQYGLPAGEAGIDMALIINKGLASEAGLDVTSPPQTMDEQLDWARKMTKKGEGDILTQIGFDPMDGTIGSGYYDWGALYGVNWWDVNTQTFHLLDLVDAINWLNDWIQEYGAANFEAFRAGFGGWLEPDSSIALGLQGMHINGYWTPGELFHKAAEGQEYAYSWVPVPSARKGKKVQASLPTGCFLPKPNKDLAASFTFMEYLCSDDANQIAFETAGGFAWTKSFLQKVDVNKYPGLDFYVKSIQEADELYCNVQNCPLGWDFQYNQFTIAANSVIYDGKPAEEALAASQKTCEEELEKLLRG